MKPGSENIGRHVRISWPGQLEDGQVGQIIAAKQFCYDVAIGCLVLTLEPKSLTFVKSKTVWVDEC